MLSRTLKTAGLLGAGLLIFASFALGASKSVTLGQDVILPGGGTLKAGTYNVVVNSNANEVEFIQEYKVMATAPCKFVEGPVNEQTSALTEQTPDGKLMLQEIQLAGEARTISLGS